MTFNVLSLTNNNYSYNNVGYPISKRLNIINYKTLLIYEGCAASYIILGLKVNKARWHIKESKTDALSKEN